MLLRAAGLLCVLLALFGSPHASRSITIVVDGAAGANGAAGSGSDPGDNGLPGEHAVARADLETDTPNYAEANGGDGGAGGDGGGALPGGDGGDGGVGGDAEAVALSRAGGAVASAEANGGNGGDPGASGGGLPGEYGDGGAATATATTLARSGTATARAEATGGAGQNGGAASAVGTAEGPRDVLVEVMATGGAGASGSSEQNASAFGRSTGGGDVEVEAILIGGVGARATRAPGSSAIAVNAVAGETRGALELWQWVYGGGGFGGDPGGDAESQLDATNPGGGSLRVSSLAYGGHGSEPLFLGRPDASGGDALASAVATGSDDADVQVMAWAVGGWGIGRTGRGGAAALGPVYGSSPAGGAVRVEGRAIGGFGSWSNEFSGLHADVALTDAVDGDSSGSLTLYQQAFSYGRAESHLARAKACESLVVASEALGNDALARVDATNTAGDVQAIAHADGRIWGDATVEVRAVATKKGAEVLVGLPEMGGGAPFHEFGAAAGNSNNGSNGASAVSRSFGIHTGDGAVAVYDRALGGASFNGGSAGDASSEAYGTNIGRKNVAVQSRAIGGTSLYAVGGDAAADAEANTGGRARADAIAQAGYGETLDLAGSARAEALATGARADAFAEARTPTSHLSPVRDHLALAARAQIQAKETSRVEADLRSGALAALTPDADGSARVAHELSATTLATALEGNANVAAAFGGAEPIALAALSGGGDRSIRLAAEVELLTSRPPVSAFDQLVIGFLGADFEGSARLGVVVEADGRRVFKASLRPDTNPLDDLVLTLDALPAESVRIAITLKTRDSGAASLDFLIGAVPAAVDLALRVPEPAVPAAVGLALSVPEPHGLLLLALLATLLRLSPRLTAVPRTPTSERTRAAIAAHLSPRR